MGKKWMAAAAAVLVLSLICGCSSLAEKQPAAVEALEPVPPTGDPVYIGSDIAGSPFVGSFINTFCAMQASGAEKVYADEEHTPSLICREDGTFTLTVVSDMLNPKTREIKGVFSVDGENAEFVPADNPNEAFFMKMINGNEMRFVGEGFDSVTNGDIFGRITE